MDFLKMTRSFAIAFGVLVITTVTVIAAPIRREDVENISKAHQRWWGTELERRFEELPKTGMVEKYRRPWSGHIYPDKNGGCVEVLSKYDRAFYRGRYLASGYERHDIEIHKSPQKRRGGLLGILTVTRNDTPDWAGHCNGWTAAAIRHAEPKKNVVRNGVVFTPSDIKGLMAELYVYGDIELLGGSESTVNAATLHLVLANWIGMGQHPVGMDNTLGKEIWNYPVYSYKSSSAMRGDRVVEVKTNIGYVNSVDSEYDEAPERYKFMYFHYWLDLDLQGKIVGGGFYRDSSQIDLLWVPLKPAQGGQPGNKEGNPYLSMKEVMSMWRDSVPVEDRAQWYNINPLPEDAVVPEDAVEAAPAEDPPAENVEGHVLETADGGVIIGSPR